MPTALQAMVLPASDGTAGAAASCAEALRAIVVQLLRRRSAPDRAGQPEVRAARAALGLKQKELAKLAGVSPRTIFKIENEGDARMESVFRVQQAFEKLGDNFSWNQRSRRLSIELPVAPVDPSPSREG